MAPEADYSFGCNVLHAKRPYELFNDLVKIFCNAIGYGHAVSSENLRQQILKKRLSSSAAPRSTATVAVGVQWPEFRDLLIIGPARDIVLAVDLI